MREIVDELGCSWNGSGGGEALDMSPWAFVYIPLDTTEQEMIAKFEGYEEVEFAFMNDIAYLMEGGSEGRGDEGSRAVGYDFGEYYLDASGFTEAFEPVKCDNAVTVAVLDSGAPDVSIDDLAPNVDYARSYNALPGHQGERAGTDETGHGTTVAGVISAVAGNDAGCTGASWNATVLPIQITNGEAIDKQAVFNSFDYILGLDDRPDVVNMSFGGPDADVERVKKYQGYIDRLTAVDIVCVASSGNDNNGWEFGKDNEVNYPAALDGVISVGALGVPLGYMAGGDYDPVIADFSNTNSDVDICAHGTAIKVLRKNPLSVGGLLPYRVVEEMGTSFAAPQVAAAAALVTKAHPGYSADDIEKAIVETATKASVMQGANHTDEYGYGVLNAEAAVMWSNLNTPVRPGGGNLSPTAGGSLLDTYREAEGR